MGYLYGSSRFDCRGSLRSSLREEARNFSERAMLARKWLQMFLSCSLGYQMPLLLLSASKLPECSSTSLDGTGNFCSLFFSSLFFHSMLLFSGYISLLLLCCPIGLLLVASLSTRARLLPSRVVDPSPLLPSSRCATRG